MKEKILNLPNTMSFLRIVLTPVIIYMILHGSSIISVAAVFGIAMLTDAIDGNLARALHQTTQFGRRLDVVADRILMIGTVTAFYFLFAEGKQLFSYSSLLIILILSREIIALPFLLYAFVKEQDIPHVRKIGKLQTLLQGITFPAVMLSFTYPAFSFAIVLVVITCINGIISGIVYSKDILNYKQNQNKI